MSHQIILNGQNGKSEASCSYKTYACIDQYFTSKIMGNTFLLMVYIVYIHSDDKDACCFIHLRDDNVECMYI